MCYHQNHFQGGVAALTSNPYYLGGARYGSKSKRGTIETPATDHAAIVDPSFFGGAAA